MATAREYFKFMRECARAGQVVQLQSTADGKYVVYGWGRELRPLGKPLSTPAAALAAALCWLYGTDQPKHEAIKSLAGTPTAKDFLQGVRALGWDISPTMADTWYISRTEKHITALGGGFAPPSHYKG